jgi:hypothetical protein
MNSVKILKECQPSSANNLEVIALTPAKLATTMHLGGTVALLLEAGVAPPTAADTTITVVSAVTANQDNEETT